MTVGAPRADGVGQEGPHAHQRDSACRAHGIACPGAVLCQRKSGAIFAREACKKKETAVDLTHLGVLGSGTNFDDRYYSKTESDGRYHTKTESDDRYYTKTESDDQYFTKTESDARCDASHAPLSRKVTKAATSFAGHRRRIR